MQSTDHSLNSSRSRNLLARLERHPELQARIESLLQLVENADGSCNKADEAEQRLASELRQLGQQSLQCWAQDRHARIAKEFDSRSDLAPKGKKSSGGTPDTGSSR